MNGRRRVDVERLKQDTNIVEVIGRSVALRRAGIEYLGRCPFHDDSRPSMSVSEGKGVYHCFSCGAGGDVIGFVMDLERIGFREAIERLGGSL